MIEEKGAPKDPFNRAKLFNVGVIEGIFNYEFRYLSEKDLNHMCYCIILHDVDMIPVSTETLKYM